MNLFIELLYAPFATCLDCLSVKDKSEIGIYNRVNF